MSPLLPVPNANRHPRLLPPNDFELSSTGRSVYPVSRSKPELVYVADERLQFGDAVGLGGTAVVGLEDVRQAVEEGGLPQGQEGGTELVLAAHLRWGGVTGEEVEDHLRLELGGERAAGTTGHDRHYEGTRVVYHTGLTSGAHFNYFSPDIILRTFGKSM